MTSQEKKYYTKKFMPKYMRVWNILFPLLAVALAVYGLAVVFSGVVFRAVDTDICLILLIVLLVYALVVLFGGITVNIILNRKLVAQRKKELEEEFAQMTLEEASAELMARGVINEKGFTVPNLAGAQGLVPYVPFGEVTLNFNSANVCSKILTAVTVCNMAGSIMAEYLVDRALYNYLEKSNFKASFFGGSDLLFGDKGAFVKKVIRTRNAKGRGYSLLGGWFFMMLAENAKNSTPEMQTVLRVLNKENI